MPAYLVAVCSYPDRAAAESVRDLIDGDAADNAIDGAPSRIVATSVHDTPPVILAGLVRGGEYGDSRLTPPHQHRPAPVGHERPRGLGRWRY